MSETRVGIDDLALYIPAPKIDLHQLVERRGREEPRLERRLQRALQTTGQEAIRFPEPWEDSATLAAQAAHELLERGKERWDPQRVRYIAVGTETSVDMSKPIAAYVEGMLQQSGDGITNALSTFQVQHACAGGTISLLSVSALLKVAGNPEESGVVICSDIARYETPSTAEVTQGAGAVAMRVSLDPQLLDLDLRSQGYSSQDVDDFFRPLGSVTARVKGGYSVQCYHEAFEAAFDDHCARLGVEPGKRLEEIDLFVLHVPFYNMAYAGLKKLAEKKLSLSEEEATAFVEGKGFVSGIEPTTRIGNIYSGSAYMAMYFLLADEYRKHGDQIVGKELLLVSYGSGNTMSVISATVAEGAPGVIRRWNTQDVFDRARESSFDEYERWVSDNGYHQDTLEIDHTAAPAGTYRFVGIREDGYRLYQYQ
ncbi:MAG: hydroxymethylglutaryl-CoA synthase family protein [Alkalispirochaetaceae bacterium]